MYIGSIQPKAQPGCRKERKDLEMGRLVSIKDTQKIQKKMDCLTPNTTETTLIVNG